MRLHALPSTSKRFVMNERNGLHALPSTPKIFVMNKRNGFEVLGLASCHVGKQVREESVLSSYHRNIVVSSLDADHNEPQHPPVSRKVDCKRFGSEIGQQRFESLPVS